MEKRRLLAIIMAALMVITLLPSMVFASAPAGELGGKLKIKGYAAVGTTLSAEYGKAEPQGLTDDYVSFKWSRQLSETEFEEVGTEKTYLVTEEDFGYKLVLEITGREDMGLTGSLKAKTLEVAATTEEAKALAEQKTAAGEEVDTVDPQENSGEMEISGESEIEEVPQDDAQMTYDENGEIQEDMSWEETMSEDAASEDTVSGEMDVESAELDVTVSEELNTEDGEMQNIQTDGESPEPVYSAEAVTEDESGIVDFGSVEAGMEADAMKYVTIRNNGNMVLNFLSISPEHFMVHDIHEPLQPGMEVQVGIQPREGIGAGEYADTIKYLTQEGVEVAFQAQAVVTVPGQEEIPEGETLQDEIPQDETSQDEVPQDDGQQEEIPQEEPAETPTEYAIDVDLDSVIFGNLTSGYEQVTENRTVTVTNTGEGTVTLKLPQSEYFDIVPVTENGNEQNADKPVLEKGGSMAVNVQPKLGLEEGIYREELVFGIEENADITKQMAAEVTVDAAVEKVILVEAQPETVQYDSLQEGYSQPEATTVTLTNQGNTDVILEQPLAENFDVSALSSEELLVGESVTFTVVPKTGLTEGTYEEEIQIFPAVVADNEEEAEPLAVVEAKITVEKEKEEPIYRLTVKPEFLSFEAREAGYTEAPESQKVTVVNEGNTAITLEKPMSSYFRIGNLSQEVLEPGEKCYFNIRPKNGLEEGDYMETITIPNDAEADAQVEADFSVTMESVEFLGIQGTADITGLKNGTEKTAKALGLPSSVVIKTTNGKMQAGVKWNVEDSAYDPSKKEAQTFKVYGRVALPEEVENPNEISLTTSVKVSVKAAYIPKVPSASENRITGIASEGYTTQSKITFTAIGAGMENTSPRKGDVRYLPLKWKVINTNSWQDAPYTATFGITKAGTYTLKVMFERQKFDGNTWVNTGEQDTKQVNFSISQAQNVTPTPKAQQRNGGKKNAVATGDTTAIMPFVIILIVAVICIAGVVVYRKKKK